MADGQSQATGAGNVQERPARSFPPPPMIAVNKMGWIKGGEAVGVRMLDGSKLTGRLEYFSPDLGRVAVRRKQVGKTGKAVDIIALERVKLVQIIVAGHCSLQAPGQHVIGGDPALAPGIREFEINFTDGDVLRGHTIGFREDRQGLYIFPVLDKNRYFCTFASRQAIDSHSIGPLTGEMLLEDGHVNSSQMKAALDQQQQTRTQPLGQTLLGQAVVTARELETALQEQKTNLRQVRIGELLIEQGIINSGQLDDALARQKARRGKPIGEILVDMGVIRHEDLYHTLADKLGIPCVDLRKFYVDQDTVRRVPRAIIRKYNVLPLYIFDGRLVLAMENPLDWTPIDAVAFATGMHVDPVLATREEIERIIDISFNTTDLEDEHIELDFSVYKNIPEEEQLTENQYGDNIVVKLVNQIISRAYRMEASDIHIEPNSRRDTVIRVRKDGQMQVLLKVPAKLRRALTARIKIMAGLNITERRKPQDGRIDLRKFTSMDLQLRVVTLPTFDDNEDVVLRVLNRHHAVPVAGLNLSVDNEMRIKAVLKQTSGMILVVGPTGSGKTTTLHALLHHLNSGERKIWTAEDPVEIQQPGLRQLQIKNKVGLSFAQAMRAFLRADPDVIMVGEIRDAETAGIAIEASLTGHLVFSTLHTNSAVETIVRLLEMDMDPFNFSDALLAVLSQRLARRLCLKCRQPYTVTAEELHRLASEYRFIQGEATAGIRDAEHELEPILASWNNKFGVETGSVMYQAVGCPDCDQSGYQGRIGLHEVFAVNDTARALIQKRAPGSELARQAYADGMCSLRRDGIEKVLQGFTDIHEIRRVCTRTNHEDADTQNSPGQTAAIRAD